MVDAISDDKDMEFYLSPKQSTNRMELPSNNMAWLGQALYVFDVLGIPREGWEDYTLIPDHLISFSLIHHDSESQTRLRPRDFHVQFDPPYYLFVFPDGISLDIVFGELAPPESLYYWSVDPDGSSRMSEAQCMALGLPCFCRTRVRPVCHGWQWKVEIYDLVRRWQEAKGFDPTTTDFARSMGYPIVEMLAQDGHRFETCVENDEGSDLKHESGLEPMQVDEFFETIPDSQDPPTLPRQGLEESLSMDVDIENCSNRISQLRVETDLMHET
ncbi:hypothetical protein PM082_016920 [Marasmius tenuissimus]|nr:hypothetical protein PM082_016920 [Marasmius tenuissimus]